MTIQIKEQIDQSLHLLQEIFGKDLLGVYLYGSAVAQGLQKYSDVDILVVANRQTTLEEKLQLAKSLLAISGVYLKSEKRPIELTIVVAGEVNPWRYPPTFDFQYGEWLRDEFEKGRVDLWPSKEMPDLAVLITQALLKNSILYGPAASSLLAKVPYPDFIKASIADLDSFMLNLGSDTRNILLTLARIYYTLTTDKICSKADAATWVVDHIPESYRPVIERARAICVGEEEERWENIQDTVIETAQYLVSKIREKASLLEANGEWDRHSINNFANT